jgi:hypothetical protein
MLPEMTCTFIATENASDFGVLDHLERRHDCDLTQQELPVGSE